MLSEVGSLWFTASNAIAQALEKLDNDIGNARDGNEESLVQVSDDLETYKRLLDDAQMQHLELSKQSRLLIAEKDAEIKYLKSQLDPAKVSSGPNDGASGDGENTTLSGDVNLSLQKALSEKSVLEASLREVEDQLRDSMHAKNELQVLTKSYNELKKRYDIMKDDYTKLRRESEVLEKQRTDTIENLASEYSQLAAETEMIRQKSEARVSEVIKENEILVTKMHALEHSITELADRASSSASSGSPKRLSSSSSSNFVDHSATPPVLSEIIEVVPSVTSSDSVLSAPANTVVVQQVVQDNPAHIAELKEAKTKLVNLQFDLKQRDDEIQRLKASTSDAESVNQEHVSSLTKKLQLLETEKTQYQEQVDQHKTQILQLQTDLQNLQVQMQENASSGEKELITRYEAEKASLKKTIEELETLLQTEKQLFETRQQSLQSEIAALQQQVSAANEEIAQLKKEKIDKEKSLQQLTAEAQAEKASLQSQLSALQSSMSADKDSATQAFVTKIADLEQELQALKASKVAMQQQFDTETAALHAAHEAALATVKETTESSERLIVQKAQANLQATFVTEKQALEEKIQALEAQLLVAKEQYSALEKSSLEEKQLAITQERHTVTEEMTRAQEVAIAATEEKAAQTLAAQLAEQVNVHEQIMKQALLKMQEDMIAEKEKSLFQQSVEHNQQLQATISQLKEEAQVAQTEALQKLATEQEEVKKQALLALVEEKKQEMNEAIDSMTKKHEEVIAQLTAEKEQEVLAIRLAMQKIQEELQVVEQKHEAKLAASLAELEAQKNQEILSATTATRNEMQGLVDQAHAERDEHLANYTKERILRKRIHNKLLEIQGNIRVICRIRPINDNERRTGEDVDVTEITNEDEFYIQRDAQTRTKFEYDRVFGQLSQQEEVFEAVQPLCVSVLDGYNVCIFAYGQTGSGKTYTMEGYDDPGVTPRAMMELFKQVDALSGEWTYTLSLSILEIYNESIHDLLNNNNGSKEKEKLDIRQTADGNVVAGLSEVPITSMAQVNELMRQGKNNRAVGKHDMNEHSSRSHSIVTVTVRGTNRLDNATTYGKLHLIDLAGSERISKTDATGDRLKEAQNINKSLLALGDVINALGNKKALHVPYRNSKLTFLLQDSLGGNSKVLMFVNISPAVYNLGETVCSLNFASKCRSTELGQAKKQSGPAAGSEGGSAGENSAAKQLLAEKRRALMSPSASQSNLLASSSSKK